MPINLQTLDSHRLYSTFLDALEAGMSADTIAQTITDALNRAKTSYEAEQRNAKQKEKEDAVDSLLSALQICGTAFKIPELAEEGSATAKDKFINFMEAMHDILKLAPSADEEETTEKDSDNILRSFISSLQ